MVKTTFKTTTATNTKILWVLSMSKHAPQAMCMVFMKCVSVLGFEFLYQNKLETEKYIYLKIISHLILKNEMKQNSRISY